MALVRGEITLERAAIEGFAKRKLSDFPPWIQDSQKNLPAERPSATNILKMMGDKK